MKPSKLRRGFMVATLNKDNIGGYCFKVIQNFMHRLLQQELFMLWCTTGDFTKYSSKSYQITNARCIRLSINQFSFRCDQLRYEDRYRYPLTAGEVEVTSAESSPASSSTDTWDDRFLANFRFDILSLPTGDPTQSWGRLLPPPHPSWLNHPLTTCDQISPKLSMHF